MLVPALISKGLVSLCLLHRETSCQWLRGRQRGHYPKCRVPLKRCREFRLLVNMSFLKLILNLPLFLVLLTIGLFFHTVVLQEFLYRLSSRCVFCTFVSYFFLSNSVFNQYVSLAPVFSLSFFQDGSIGGFQVPKSV